jgi:hypothetical protein
MVSMTFLKIKFQKKVAIGESALGADLHARRREFRLTETKVGNASVGSLPVRSRHKFRAMENEPL